MNWNTHERVRGQLLSGFKVSLDRRVQAAKAETAISSPEALWMDCGGFRRVTPTILQFLDNRSRIMLAAGANPIFVRAYFLGCLGVESEASNERFFPRPSAIESAAVAGRGSIFSL